MLLLLDLPQVILCAPAGFAAGDFLYSCWMCRRLFFVLESCYRLCKVNKFWFARMYRLCEVNRCWFAWSRIVCAKQTNVGLHGVVSAVRSKP